MIPETLICDKCDGKGWTSEHALHPHPDGDCCGECPVQVQCEHCYSKGHLNGFDLMRHEMARRQRLEWDKTKKQSESELPF